MEKRFKYFLTIFLTIGFAFAVQAGVMKEIYTTTQEEITLYYQASGEWDVLKISDLEIVSTDLDPFIIVTASSIIRNKETGLGKKETCIVTLKRESLSPYSVNCF